MILGPICSAAIAALKGIDQMKRYYFDKFVCSLDSVLVSSPNRVDQLSSFTNLHPGASELCKSPSRGIGQPESESIEGGNKTYAHRRSLQLCVPFSCSRS
jgi:hypothetical protein